MRPYRCGGSGRSRLGTAVGVAIGVAGVCHAQNLVENGDFELEVPSNGSGGGWTSERIDGAGGWRSSGGDPGGRFILNDSGQTDSDPTIWQVVPGLAIGEEYTLSGACVITWDDGGDRGAPCFGVFMDGEQVVSFTREDLEQSGWVFFDADFVASVPQIELRISAEMNGTDYGLSIDNIDIRRYCKSADLTGDGVVDTLDFLLFLGAWAQGDPIADWDENGTINTLDFLAYLNDWVEGC